MVFIRNRQRKLAHFFVEALDGGRRQSHCTFPANVGSSHNISYNQESPKRGHGKMRVAVRACACNERSSACNARAMRMDPVHVRGICGFLYLSLYNIW